MGRAKCQEIDNCVMFLNKLARWIHLEKAMRTAFHSEGNGMRTRRKDLLCFRSLTERDRLGHRSQFRLWTTLRRSLGASRHNRFGH